MSARLICTNPFEWCEVHPDGSVFLCCPAWLKTSVGNLLAQPLSEIWNSAAAQAIRKGVLNGTFHYCRKKRCPRLATATSPVVAAETIASPDTRQAVASGRARLASGPKILNLCCDRSCNLACPSCRTEVIQNRREESSRVESILARLAREAGSSVERIILSGFGDPFASPVLRAFLQNFPTNDFPRLGAIDLHSNGQLWTRDLWATMPVIHPLVREAEISVDAATAETYGLNRPGGDFSRLLANLAFLGTLPIRVKLSMVVQANNYREIPALVELAGAHGFKAYFSQLVNWGTFSREEFRSRAVHRTEHPEHARLLTLLRQVGSLPQVDIGNLAPLLCP